MEVARLGGVAFPPLHEAGAALVQVRAGGRVASEKDVTSTPRGVVVVGEEGNMCGRAYGHDGPFLFGKVGAM